MEINSAKLKFFIHFGLHYLQNTIKTSSAERKILTVCRCRSEFLLELACRQKIAFYGIIFFNVILTGIECDKKIHKSYVL